MTYTRTDVVVAMRPICTATDIMQANNKFRNTMSVIYESFQNNLKEVSYFLSGHRVFFLHIT